jgi:hypothetical protein
MIIRGTGSYQVNLNAENPVGTVQSIERALRNLERNAEDEESRTAKLEKTLADYRVQAGRPFEQEEKFHQLLQKQQQLNDALDLNKGEKAQIVEAAESGKEDEPSMPDSWRKKWLGGNAANPPGTIKRARRAYLPSISGCCFRRAVDPGLSES